MTGTPEPPDDSPDDAATASAADATAAGGASALVEHLADRLAGVHAAADRGGPAVELAVGRRPGVAAALADRGIDVVATDVRECDVPDGVTFVRDDLTDPDEAVYAGASLLYARNLPAELQRPARELAVAVDAPLWFTTLGAEEPVLSVDRETLAADSIGETLYRTTDAPG